MATQVGEEGLDIGDVDLIISYDCLSSPVRMVQRFGRTGRSSTGKVIILITKGEEEMKKRRYEEKSKEIMQRLKQVSRARKSQQAENSKSDIFENEVWNGIERLAFFDRNPRMIPDHVTPKCEFRKLTNINARKPASKIRKTGDKEFSKNPK